jgi:hypothetical protein
MRKSRAALIILAIALTGAVVASGDRPATHASTSAITWEPQPVAGDPPVAQEPDRAYRPYPSDFDLDVLVYGSPQEIFYGRGRRYVEAIEGREYSLRIRNPYGVRVAVALSVDGLNTIDAKRTTAESAAKWVIEPYGTITIDGWQVSGSRARQFYFTTERNSYGAKLGQTANLGVISAVFFRERRPVTIYRDPRRITPSEDSAGNGDNRPAPSSSERGRDKSTAGVAQPRPDDDSAATGIGRSRSNDVSWIHMDLESRPAAEITVRYEYHDALIRLGVLPRRYSPEPDTLGRRERADGFDGHRYSPEP